MSSPPDKNRSQTLPLPHQSSSSTFLSSLRQQQKQQPRSTSSSTHSPFLTPRSATVYNLDNIGSGGSSRRSRFNRTSSRERERSYEDLSESISTSTTTEEVDEEVRPISMALESWAVLDTVMSSSYKEIESSTSESQEGGRTFSRSFSGMSNTSTGTSRRRRGSTRHSDSPSRVGDQIQKLSEDSEVIPVLESGFSILQEEPDEFENDEEEDEENGEDGDEDDEEGTIDAESILTTELSSSPTSIPIRQPWRLSKVQRNVLKCTLAYFLAELFTFLPILADLLSSPFQGPIKNAHVIASVAVYFNPGRSVGGMVEADLFMLLGVVYALFLCVGSMSMTVLMGRFGLDRLAQILVVVFWIGGGFGLIAYVKFKVNKPTMTTACSMVALFASVIITKSPAFHLGEFKFEPILLLLLIAFIGILISNIICFGIWRDDSTINLQSDLDRTLDSFEILIGLLTRTFLLDPDPPATRPSELHAAVTSHARSFTLLQSSLSLSKYEFFNGHIQRNSGRYDEVVQAMSKLAQGLTGLRSSCTFHKVNEKVAEKEAGRLLEKFKSSLAGDSLKELSKTSRNTLARLRNSLISSKSNEGSETITLADLAIIRSDLAKNLDIFQRAHSETIKQLYQEKSNDYGTDPFAELHTLVEGNESDRGPSDNLFRIYYFCFNYIQWVTDLIKLLDVFIEIKRCENSKNDVSRNSDKGSISIYSTITSIFSEPQGPFPAIVDGALTSHRVSSHLSFIGRLKQKFWFLGFKLKQPNIRFALKTGGGAALLASFAFWSETRSVWLEYRGEWSLISYMVVMQPTLGGTNFLSLGRILGTALGASIACFAYLMFQANAAILPVFGALFSMPCFYIIITLPLYGPSSRFVLLTFNLTCLYAFNLRESDVHILSIAYHRSLAVSFGVLFALVITSYIWPFEARRELRKSLSNYLLNSAHLYAKIVGSYSRPTSASKSVEIQTSPDNERTPLLPPKQKEVDTFLDMELYLQLSLLQIGQLLEGTQNEPRLKGPFPIKPYKSALISCQNLLDLLTSMRTVTSKEAWYSQVRKEYVMPVNRERREMVGNVILYFSILASALSLKTPLPPYLPPAAESRDRLAQRLLQLPVVTNRVVSGEGSETLLYLAYSVAMADVIHELEVLGKIFQSLFGGEKSTEEFNILFISSDSEV